MKDCTHVSCKLSTVYYVYMVLPVAVRYVLGHDAMRKMGASNVLIAGMKGLGVEVGMCIMCNCICTSCTYIM